MTREELTQEEHKKILIEELKESLRGIYAEDSIDKVLNIDIVNHTIDIRFNYSVVSEDNYVGLGSY